MTFIGFEKNLDKNLIKIGKDFGKKLAKILDRFLIKIGKNPKNGKKNKKKQNTRTIHGGRTAGVGGRTAGVGGRTAGVGGRNGILAADRCILSARTPIWLIRVHRLLRGHQYDITVFPPVGGFLPRCDCSSSLQFPPVHISYLQGFPPCIFPTSRLPPLQGSFFCGNISVKIDKNGTNIHKFPIKTI